MKKVSNSNTKAQILKAYEELVEELKAEKSDNTALKQKLDEQKKLVDKAQQQAEEGSMLSIQTIRSSINQQLDQLEGALHQEQDKFTTIRGAIEVEKATLENLYKIKTEAESLDALIITNRQAKERLEKDMAEKKAELLHDIEETKRRWEREQESYEYNLRIIRRNEEDEYKQKKAQQEKELAEQKAAFEQEMSEREKAVAEKEAEFKRLQAEAAQFDSRLQQAVEQAREEVSSRLTQEFEYRQKLEVKDLEADLKLSQQAIESLKMKIQEQQDFISSLTSRTENASQQVKDIALKAIENSGLRSLNLSSSERYREEKKGDS